MLFFLDALMNNFMLLLVRSFLFFVSSAFIGWNFQVNGISLENVEHSQAVTVLRSAGYDVTLVIVRTSCVTDSQVGSCNMFVTLT